MAKGHFQFRPKDGAILSFLRQEAAKDKRSLNSWMEVHFEQVKDKQENLPNVIDVIHKLLFEKDKIHSIETLERWEKMIDQIHSGIVLTKKRLGYHVISKETTEKFRPILETMNRGDDVITNMKENLDSIDPPIMK